MLHPRSILPFLFIHAFAYSVLAQESSLKEEQDYAFALGLFRDKGYQMAFNQFEQFMTTFPESDLRIDATYYAAECLYQQERLTDASIRFRAFQDTYPKSKLADDAGFREGEVYFRQTKYEKAYEQFSSVVENYPEGNLAHEAAYWAGEASFKNEDIRNALRYYSISYEHYPEGRIRDYAFFSIGFVHESTKNFEKALAAYNEFLKKFSRSALRSSVYTRIGACLVQQKDYSGALSWFDSLTDSPDPENAAERLFFKAEANYQLGHFSDAEQWYKSFLAAYPFDKRADQVRYSLGWSYIEQKKYSEAIATFEELGKGDDTIAESARFRKGMALRLSGNLAAARQVLENMLSSKPSGEYADNAAFELGMAAFEEKSFKVASVFFKQVTEKYPGSDILADGYYMQGECALALNTFADAVSLYQRALRQENVSTQTKSNAMFRLGYSHYMDSTFEAAAGTFEQFLQEYPADIRKPDALIWLGESYFKLSRFADAEIAYNQALVSTQEPLLIQDALYGLGWASYSLQKYTDAEKTFKRLTTQFKTGKHDVDANVRLGDSQYAQKNFSDAIKTYRYTSRMYPNNPLTVYALLQLGNAEHRTGDTPSGIGTLKSLLSKYPDSEYADKAQLSLGWFYFQSKDYNGAIKEYQKLLQTYPNSDLLATAKYSIGDSYYNLGNYSDAGQAYRTVLNDHPDSPLVSNALDGIGQCLRMQGKDTEAAKVKEEWLKSNQRSKIADEVVFNNAKNQFEEKNLNGAILSLQNFIKSYPASKRYQEAFLLLGKGYREIGKYEEARNTFREAIAKSPETSVATQAVFELANVAVDGQNWDEALTLYGQLLTNTNATARRSEIFYRRGYVFERDKKLDKARADFLQAM